MTTRTFPVSEAVRRAPYKFPDPPPPDDMNDYLFLSVPGYPPALIRHLGNRDTTAVMAGIYVSRQLPRTQKGLFYPDLLIAFDVDPEAIIARKGFVIAEQGKPPDFVLEVGSDSTGLRDVREKRAGYANLGIPEYWRFDPSGGEYHRGAALAGDRWVNGQYEPFPIHRTDDGGYRGYSPALNIELRWENGKLLWYDPDEQRYLLSYDEATDESAEVRSIAQFQRDTARAERDTAEARLDTLQAERDTARIERDIAEAQRDTAEAQLDTVQAQRDSAQAERGIVEAQRDTAQAERDTARAERDTAEARLDIVQVQRDTAEARLDTVQAQRDSAEAQRDIAQIERDSAQAERGIAEARLDTVQAERDAAVARARELEEQLRRLQNPDQP